MNVARENIKKKTKTVKIFFCGCHVKRIKFYNSKKLNFYCNNINSTHTKIILGHIIWYM